MPSEIALHSPRDTGPPDRIWLRQRTEEVETLTYRSACDTVRIGVILEEVRGRLKQGDYEAWVKKELPFSLPTAHRYRQVAKAFGQFVSSHFERFDPSALYVLAQLSVPPAAREHAVTMVEFGQRITRADALEIIDAHRPIPDDAPVAPKAAPALKMLQCVGEVTDKETKEKVRCPVSFLTTPEFRFCPKCRVARDGPECGKPTSPELLAKRWQVLLELAEECSEVRITKVEDSEDPEPLYSVTCHRPDDRPHNVVRRELYDALTVLAGKQETRYCSGYKPLFPQGHDTPIGLFGKNKTNPDGLMYRCRTCERARRAQMREEKRLAKKAAESDSGGKKAA